jgi:hypothetical protein
MHADETPPAAGQRIVLIEGTFEQTGTVGEVYEDGGFTFVDDEFGDTSGCPDGMIWRPAEG